MRPSGGGQGDREEREEDSLGKKMGKMGCVEVRATKDTSREVGLLNWGLAPSEHLSTYNTTEFIINRTTSKGDIIFQNWTLDPIKLFPIISESLNC